MPCHLLISCCWSSDQAWNCMYDRCIRGYHSGQFNDNLTSIWGSFCSMFYLYFCLNLAVNQLQLWYPPLKNVLDAALIAAAYCWVSIAYQARDVIYGLMLWQIRGLIVPSVHVRRWQQGALLTHDIRVFWCWDLRLRSVHQENPRNT